jgi:twitching motility protein PilT
VATEILVTTPAVSNLIREGKTYQVSSSMQAGRALGMQTLDQHLAELVNDGLITRQSAEEKAQDLEGLAQLIRRVDVSDPAANSMLTGGIDFGDSFSPRDAQ